MNKLSSVVPVILAALLGGCATDQEAATGQAGTGKADVTATADATPLPAIEAPFVTKTGMSFSCVVEGGAKKIAVTLGAALSPFPEDGFALTYQVLKLDGSEWKLESEGEGNSIRRDTGSGFVLDSSNDQFILFPTNLLSQGEYHSGGLFTDSWDETVACVAAE